MRNRDVRIETTEAKTIEVDRAPSGGGRRLARLHNVAGLTTLVAFLLSGQYMRHHQPPLPSLDAAHHAIFTSRHIYILAAALVNLTLGAYVTGASGRRRRTAQQLGSALVVAAAALLVAFVVEAMSGHGPTAASSYGLYSLFAGSLLHVVASFRRSAPN